MSINRRNCSRIKSVKRCCGSVPGTPGADGIDGIDGTDGIDGINGIDGTNGVDGIDGINGVDGTNGADGVDGTNGADGVDGINGTDGTNGTNGTGGNLLFGAAVPTSTTHEDNDSFLVTSDGTPAGTIQQFLKFDIETTQWVTVPLGGGSSCPDYVTRQELITLRDGYNLNQDCHYLIADWVTYPHPDIAFVYLHSMDESTLSHSGLVAFTNSQAAWYCEYDIDTDELVRVVDNIGNDVSGTTAVLAFPWENPDVAGNTVQQGGILNYTSGVVTNNTIRSESSLTVDAVLVSDNYISGNTNVVINNGSSVRDNTFSNGSAAILTNSSLTRTSVTNGSTLTATQPNNLSNSSVDGGSSLVVTGQADDIHVRSGSSVTLANSASQPRQHINAENNSAMSCATTGSVTGISLSNQANFEIYENGSASNVTVMNKASLVSMSSGIIEDSIFEDMCEVEAVVGSSGNIKWSKFSGLGTRVGLYNGLSFFSCDVFSTLINRVSSFNSDMLDGIFVNCRFMASSIRLLTNNPVVDMVNVNINDLVLESGASLILETGATVSIVGGVVRNNSELITRVNSTGTYTNCNISDTSKVIIEDETISTLSSFDVSNESNVIVNGFGTGVSRDASKVICSNESNVFLRAGGSTITELVVQNSSAANFEADASDLNVSRVSLVNQSDLSIRSSSNIEVYSVSASDLSAILISRITNVNLGATRVQFVSLSSESRVFLDNSSTAHLLQALEINSGSYLQVVSNVGTAMSVNRVSMFSGYDITVTLPAGGNVTHLHAYGLGADVIIVPTVGVSGKNF